MSIKVVTNNRKAYHDYFVEETYEAGIVLSGNEVKSIRLGNINLKDSFIIIKEGQLYLISCHISPYDKGSYFNSEATRNRVLLMNRAEIRKLRVKIEQKGYTLVPTKVYFKDSLVKVEVGLCRGKATYDKRDTIKGREHSREIERALKENYKK